MVKRKTEKTCLTLRPRKCKCCGKTFMPFDADDWGCSPICRSLANVKSVDKTIKERKRDFRKKMESTRYIPKLNLKKNPMARVDWVMSLPLEYRGKFTRFFNDREAAYMKELCKSMLAEERQYLGYFVKKDKIVVVKGSKDEEPVEAAPDTLDNDGTENEDN